MNASEDGTKTAARKLPVSVNFLAASIPLYFKVTRLYDYAFKHENARRTLEEVATQEVVRYLANVDFSGILSTQRARCGEELRLRIQKRADSLELGIEIVFVGLQGIHPPVRVGKAFDEVVAAMQAEHEVVLQAEKYAISVAARADGDAAVRKSEAASYRNERIQVAAAEAARFDKQLVSYRAAPQLYVLYSFLDMLENEGAAARKYIVALSGSHEVFQFDFVQKLRPDLTDLDLDKK